ncbi:MAG TPA: type II secretion system F family protein [Cytophagaceae bacterium]|nr:type II secretion system F family protein [Cytophagaceae bacterium]
MAVDISNYKNVSSSKVEESSLIDKITAVFSKDISFGSKELSDKKKESFYHELAILLEAGVDIRSSLEMIAMEQVNQKDKDFFDKLKEDVIAGVIFSEALKNTGKFSLTEYYSIKIGEETGRLITILKDLTEYYVKKIKQKRQLISALTYPCIVLLTSVGAVLFMLNFIVPMFADVFKRFGGKLPWITQMIVNLSTVLGQYIYYMLFLIIAIVTLIYSQRERVWFRKYSAYILLHLPFFGEMFRKIYLAQFCHSMALLVSSRIPLLKALSMVRQMTSFYPIEVSLLQIEKDVMMGMSLNKSMSAYSVYPVRMISLIKVGEEVNQLDTFFGKISKQCNDEVEHQTAVISSLIEPLMILFLGGVVGLILVAMYLPLFQLSSTFK